MSINDIIFGTGIVPVIVLKREADGVPLAKALVKGGVPVAEVTFRTEAAEGAIRQIAKEVPEILVGAGTVLDAKTAERAIAAGAKFIVSPGLSLEVIQCCAEKHIPVFPGCSTATEVQQAVNLGLTEIKFFPAEQSGGASMIKALRSPFGTARFMPTGGVNQNNLSEYIKLDNVIACGGSWLCPSKLVEEGRFDEITKLCREAVCAVHGFRLLHVGLNQENEEEAAGTAKQLCNLFSLPQQEHPNSLFAGDMFEIMKRPFLGTKGHIAIGVYNLRRAMRHFENLGYSFRDEGKIEGVCAYFREEVGGFAIHLKQL